MILASLTSDVTDLVSKHGVVAVFAVMAVDAVLPVGGELTMLLAGAVAAGAVGTGTSLLGTHVPGGLDAYLVLALAGTLGYLAGAVLGWVVGRRGGQALLERHGRWLHLGPARMARAERWFDRHGAKAVLLGRLTPLVRSFISIPAGVLRAPLPLYVALTAVGSAIWCFAFAGAGWALGDQWDIVHRAFRYLDVLAVLAVVGVAGAAFLRHRAART
jgi:membrane protein DedA with SNARE-associated domain